ncbi:MAG: hypothetical protein IT271_10240 [Chitinophagales bacterium]|nr:hypothetical protein [Chitinophagales bacterium]
MKKSILLTFVLAAGFVATFLTGCGDGGTDGPTCFSIAGRDTGAHVVYIDALNPGLTPISDTLDATVSGSNVSIFSTALGRTLTGTISASNCNSIALDSVIFAEGDTLKISSSTLPVPGGVVKIWNIRGGGTGTITSTGATTRINIAKGNTNITAPINLSNLAGLKLNLRGTFLKLN